ncbi:MAG: glycosyltransferase family 39 protein [Isosphaeraceae bacterium]|nr:glycosyltransferase family 39 protein [Isosphaeraceae bacterium]
MSAAVPAETHERRLVAVLTLAGVVARFWAFGRLGLTHFDEGIYAISGLWAVAPRGLSALDAGVVPYAPPGFPVVVGLAYGLLGVSDSAAILSAAVFGVAAVPLAGWVGRRTFGPGAGVAAAAFAAFSVAAIAFSRKALTDIPFLVCWLLAMGAAARFLERPGCARAIVLGLTVGLAQYFKYNGWLAGAVTMIAAFAGPVANPGDRKRAALVRTFGFGLLGACVAAVVYAPWYLFVERHGGYSALLRHQRSYLGDAASWLPHWELQLAQAHALSGAPFFPIVAWAVAWSSACWTAGATPRSTRRAGRYVAGLVLGSLLLGAVTSLPWWIGLGAWLWLLRRKEPAHRVLGASWLVLSVLTPFYHPYARLWLPLHAAGWILVAGVTAKLAVWQATGLPEQPWLFATHRTRVVVLGSMFSIVLAATAQTLILRPVVLPISWVFQPAPSLREATATLAPVDVPESRRPTFVVLARRPLAFYLNQARQRVTLAEGVKALLGPTRADTRAIVDEVLLAQDGDVPRAVTDLERFWMVEERFVDELDPVTLLDIDPGAAYRPHPKRRFFVWRLAPIGAAGGRPPAGDVHE